MTTINENNNKRFPSNAYLTPIVFLGYTGLGFFLSYGGLNWLQAWILLSLWLAYFVVLLLWGKKDKSGVLQERADSLKKIGKSWDRYILPIYIMLTLALNIISGLDAGRFHWSNISTGTKLLVFPFVLSAYVLPLWAITSNPFTSGVSRIQEERGQQTISSGPYRFIRHPMYIATIIYGLTFPIFLGSWWALIPGALAGLLFIIRTMLEDKMLHEKLPGYAEYALETRFRLVPGIW